MPADTLYTPAFYDAIEDGAATSAAAVSHVLCSLVGPATVLDVGCGRGVWLAAFANRGCGVFGVDGPWVDTASLDIPVECFRRHDLTQPLDTGRRFDLVVCLEVAEHLPGESAETLVDTLARHGDVIAFSAAGCGDPGVHHVNCRPAGYWAELFEARGYRAYDAVRPEIAHDSWVEPWYRSNLFLYVKDSEATEDLRRRLPAPVRFVDWRSVSTRPRVAVVLPAYGDVNLGAAKAYCAPNTHDLPDEDRVDIRVWHEAATSATGNCFNHLLGPVLDLRDQGVITHLAMIHSDVVPRWRGWVNTQWREMRLSGADLVSTVVAIKDRRGRTSTAVGLRSDPWGAIRHVMLADRKKLPTTFTIEDVGDPATEVLLVNTGMFLADLRHPAWDSFPGFNLTTRLGRDSEGRRQPQMRPEDWEMSRHLDACGARVAATWAVRCKHYGSYGWDNYGDDE